MTAWIIAAMAGAAIAVAMYVFLEGGIVTRLTPLIALRAVALTLLIALLLGAPAGPSRLPIPSVALDVSASWLRGGDTARWTRAAARASRLAEDSILLFGDTVASAPPPTLPTATASRLQPVAERALGIGRPVMIITDGEIDDPSAIRGLPAGSRIEVMPAEPRRDLAVLALDAPRSAVLGDTIEARVTVRAGNVPVTNAIITLLAAGRRVAATEIDSIGAGAERTETIRVALGAAGASAVLTAVASAPGDSEPRNDTVGVTVDLARAAGAVLVSTSPDQDARFMLPVLRGAVSLPTRAYFRVAPGQWRVDGSLASVPEAEVRRAMREAPLVIIHGDTALFGPPRAVTNGSLALVSPPVDGSDEVYPVSAPSSPIAATLTGIAWDSLPPVDAGRAPQSGEWQGLIAARARQFDRRAVVAGTDIGRRVVVIAASGFWRWRFRGGTSASAYDALLGSIFDWLSAERSDVRAAVPDGSLRAGEVLRWRRGGRGDSVVVVSLRRRDTRAPAESLTLSFGRSPTTESDPLAPGVYDVGVPGGGATVVVNASRELLPRSATLRSGAVAGGAAAGDQPRLRDRGWPFVFLLLLLCTEWVSRRRFGMR